MRKKTLVFDGAEFTIAPLNFIQVERYLAPIEANLPEPETKERLERQHFQMICDSLNNAQAPAALPGEATSWTPERIKNEMDYLLVYEMLSPEIHKFSGLEQKKPQGEAPAVSEKSSPKSEAASLP